MYGLMWVFCEWADKIKARKFVPQQVVKNKIQYFIISLPSIKKKKSNSLFSFIILMSCSYYFK